MRWSKHGLCSVSMVCDEPSCFLMCGGWQHESAPSFLCVVVVGSMSLFHPLFMCGGGWQRESVPSLFYVIGKSPSVVADSASLFHPLLYFYFLW